MDGKGVAKEGPAERSAEGAGQSEHAERSAEGAGQSDGLRSEMDSVRGWIASVCEYADTVCLILILGWILFVGGYCLWILIQGRILLC